MSGLSTSRELMVLFLALVAIASVVSGFQRPLLWRQHRHLPGTTTSGCWKPARTENTRFSRTTTDGYVGSIRIRTNAASEPAAENAGSDADSSSSRQPTNSTSSSTTSKERLTHAYRIGQYTFGAASALILSLPDRTMTTLLATKLGGFAGFALAAGLCHILQGAASHNRLSSETYQRLNVGLLGFSALGLTAVPAEAGFLGSFSAALAVTVFLTLVKLYGTALAFVGWKQGVMPEDITTSSNSSSSSFLAPKRMLRELVQGTKATVKGLKVKTNNKGLTYRNCLLLLCMGVVSSFMEGLFNIRYQKEFTRTWFEISLQWSAVARLFMLTTMVYSLKDAAERDRLTGTTFIQMNLMVGFWAVVVGLGQAVYPLGFAAYRGVELFAFSFPFFLKAFKAVKEKSEKANGLE